MLGNIQTSISERSARASFFLFFTLLFLSVTFFALADDTVTDKNIFQDSDQDGLSNDEEVLYKTDPLNKDSDSDGYMDGVEVAGGYDPLKPAPGDRVVENVAVGSTDVVAADDENLTEQVSSEIANMVQVSKDEGGDVSMETVNESVQKIMDEADEEIVLPEINIEEIKTKTVSPKLKEAERQEKEKEDAVEYLTVLAYILANNSPKTFHSERDFQSVMESVGMDTVTAMALGDTAYLAEFSKRGEKIMKELKDLSVPERMLDVHVKATKLAKYSMKLKEEAATNGTDDPLGQIASLAKVQGFLMVVGDFSMEVADKLDEYGIENIPLNP